MRIFFALGMCCLVLFSHAQDFLSHRELTGVNILPDDISFSDFNEDGLIDMLVSSNSDDRVTYYPRLDDFIFGLPITISEPGLFSSFVSSGDLDGDGHIDVVMSTDDYYSIQWLKGEGDGTFSSSTIIDSGCNASKVLLIDLDNDQDLDMICACWYEIKFLENNGEGDFLAPVLITDEVSYTRDVVLEDFDGDGDLDLASASYSSNTFAWYENLGAGVFGAQNIIEANTFSSGATSIDAADYDMDGDMDILISSSLIGVSWAINDGLGNFSVLDQVSIPSYDSNFARASDVDNDGDVDIVTVNGDAAHWFENLGDGVYNSSPIDLIDQAYINSREIHISDFNGNGLDDFIVLDGHNSSAGWIDLIENVGDGEFELVQRVSPQTISPFFTESADFNGDGHLDLLSASYNDFKISWYPATEEGIYDRQTIIHQEQYYFVYDLRIADMNADSYPDIVTSSSLGLWVFVNNGEGEFVIQEITGTTWVGRDIDIADIDGDGTLDILVSDNNEDEVSVFFGNQTGDFSDEQFVATDIGLVKLPLIADFDGDGLIDLVGPDVPGGELVFCRNIGGLQFEEGVVIWPSGDQIDNVSIIDYQEDLDKDLVLSIRSSHSIVILENGKLGCTDPEACNYQTWASIENGSCCYFDCGCTTVGAQNYNENALCDDGNCKFPVLGTVFFDENENGIMEESEYGLPLQQVELLPGGIQLTTNDNGHFFVSADGSNEYIFSLAESELFPFNTTPETLTFDAAQDNWNQDIKFGVSNEESQFGLEVSVYPFVDDYDCDVATDHATCIQNTGNYPIDILLAFEYDSLFQGYSETSPIDSVNDNVLYMSYQGLIPGQSICKEFALNTPGVSFLGEFLFCNAQVIGYQDGVQMTDGEDTSDLELTCAYDPNDKQVFPAGYTEAHYIPEEEYLEYLIRFQNTGNAPATDVIIRDTLDDGLDISTFQLVANSHSVFTTVDPESREVEFYFQDIQLPDSVNNEPESHGLVSFKVRPEAGLPLLTELNNTAAIFFDNNPPIITNTTWSTIYDCTLFEVEFTQDGAILTASEGDSYQWYMDGEPIEGATSPIFEAFENGDYAVEISNDFPCSELTSSIFIAVDGIEELAGSPITLFPNPMTSSAILDIGDLGGDFTLEIFDIKGQLMRQQILNIESGILNLARGNLSPGRYLLLLSNSNSSFELPFVVE